MISLLFQKIKTLTFFLFLFLTILFFPILFVLLQFSKFFFRIRFIEILTNRYGHLSVNPECYIVNKNKSSSKIKYLDLFCESKYGICNKELFKLWKKKITILPRYLIGPINLILNKIYTPKKNPHTIINFTEDYRELNLSWEKHKPSINLSKEQVKTCEEILINNKISINKIRFVCLFNRDDAYLKSNKYNKSWYYLSHHNYDIKKFNLMANELTKKEIYVFRMGAKAEGLFGENNLKIIDYANSKFRSELMDIFLASRCLFGINCGTGSAGVALLYRKPILDLNANIYLLLTNLKGGVMLSKHYYSKKLRRNLKLQELMKFNFDDLAHREQLDANEIEVIDCSDEEIMEACLELLYRINGKWQDTAEDVELQNTFKKKYDINKRSSRTNLRWHGDVIRSNYSNNFLKKNKDWLN